MKKQFFRLIKLLFYLICLISLVSCAGGLSKRESARVYYNLGNAYFELGKNDEASSAYLRALDFDDDLKVASFNLARTYIETEKYSEALRLLDNMLEKDSENTLVHSAKGYCLFRLGDYNAASESYLDVLEINPGDQDALFNYALIMTELEDYNTAIEKFAALKNTNPDDDFLMKKIDFAIGRVYYLQEDLNNSLQYLESVFEKDPQYDKTAEYLFNIYEKKKYYGKMINTGKKILEKDKSNSSLQFTMSRVLLLEIEDSEQGLEYFQKAVENGFNDKEKIDKILSNENLTVKKELEKILENSAKKDD